MSNRRHEVVVVGGGMVGAAAVLALRRAGVDCALVDPAPVPQWSNDEVDLRVSAISPASEQLLRALEVWPAIAAARVSPYTRMHVWERHDAEALDFDCGEFAELRLGHIVENSLLVAELRRAIGDDGIYSESLAGFDHANDALWLRLSNGHEMRTRLLVGADGVNSRVRELAGIEMRGGDYRQRGLVCHIGLEKSHEQTAWQRFLPGGPLALLPLADGRCSIVWSLPGDEARRLEQLEEGAFSNELMQAFGSRLGRLSVDSARASFPLSRRHALAYTAGRIALIGDAAHVVHPLAGQGGNLGLLDAAELAAQVGGAQQRGIDPGHPAILRRYERRRRADNLAMLAVTDGLERLFSSRSAWAEGARRIGMGWVNGLAPIRNALIRHAMYGPTDAPPLVRQTLTADLS